MGSQQVTPPGIDDHVADQETQLDRDEIFEILRNRRRRYILHYLKQQQDRSEVPLHELVDHVAAWEHETPLSELDTRKRKRVYTAARQSHLPKLAELGVVDYDRQAGTIRLTDAAQAVELYLEYVPQADLSWDEYYLTLSGICLGVVGASYLGLPVVADLSGLVLAGVIVGVIIVSSIVHVYYTHTHRIGAERPPTEQYP